MGRDRDATTEQLTVEAIDEMTVSEREDIWPEIRETEAAKDWVRAYVKDLRNQPIETPSPYQTDIEDEIQRQAKEAKGE